MNETIKHPTLSPAAAAHLENLLNIEAGRRAVDAELRSPIVDARDTLLCAASNLECGQPQQQLTIAARLRAVADLLVELDVAHCELRAAKTAFRFVRAPRLRQLAERVRGMPHDDAHSIANSLLNIADGYGKEHDDA